MKFWSVIVLAAGMISLFTQPSFAESFAASKAQDAVAYQIDPAHSGSIALTNGFTGNLKQLWSVNLNGIVSYPLIARGVAFVTVGNGSSGDFFYAFNLTTGKKIWEKILAGNSGWADAAYDHDSVFVVNGQGTLTAFRALSGAHLWTVQLPSASCCGSGGVGAPVAAGGLVYLQAGNSNSGNALYAIDETTGQTKWKANVVSLVSGIGGAATLGGGGIYVGGTSGLSRFVTLSGAPVWQVQSGCAASDAPMYFGGNLYVAEGGNCCCSGGGDFILDATTGTQTNSFIGIDAPTQFEKKGIVTNSGGTLYDYSPESDNVYWTFTADQGLSAKPIAVNGLIVALSSFGNLYVINGATGAQISKTSLAGGGSCCSVGPDTGLAAGEGTLVVPSGTSLYAFTSQ